MARSGGTPVRAQFSNAASADNGSVLFIGAVDQIPIGLPRPREGFRTSAYDLAFDAVSKVIQGGTAGRPLPEFHHAHGAGLARPSGSPLRPTRSAGAGRTRSSGAAFSSRPLGSLQDWVEKTFSLSLAPCRWKSAPMRPMNRRSAPSLSWPRTGRETAGVWTLVTARAPTRSGGRDGPLANPMLWSQVAGRAVALDPREMKLQVEPINDFASSRRSRFSLRNMRLVAANWMSANILQYALLMLACCTFLGVATYCF